MARKRTNKKRKITEPGLQPPPAYNEKQQGAVNDEITPGAGELANGVKTGASKDQMNTTGLYVNEKMYNMHKQELKTLSDFELQVVLTLSLHLRYDKSLPHLFLEKSFFLHVSLFVKFEKYQSE